MKILSCHIENFGKLQNYDCSWTDGFNIIRQSNGWGKSTLMAFIKSMFYGLANDGKRSLENERKRYDPWQGGTFGGRLRFECEGNEYEVVRTFGKKSAEDKVAVYDCSTMMPADRFKISANGMGESLGRLLFGIDEDSFSRSVFIAQGNAAGQVTSDINAKISNLADNTNDMGNYELAMENIKNALNALSENRSTGRLSAEISLAAHIKGEVLKESSVIESMKLLEEKISSVNTAINALTEENVRLSSEMDRLAKRKEEQIRREKYMLYDEACREAFENYKAAEKEEIRFKAYETEKFRKSGFCTAGYIILAVGVIFILADSLNLFDTGGILTLSGLLFFIAGAVCTLTGFMINRRTKFEKSKRHDAYIEAKTKLSSALETYKKTKKELDTYTEECGTAFSADEGNSFEDGCAEGFDSGVTLGEKIRSNLNEIQRLRKILAVYDEQAEERREQLDELSDKKIRLEELEQSIAEGRIKVRRLELARELLRKAKNNMTAKYIAPLSQHFVHYYETLTGSSAAEYMLDAESNISFDSSGERHRQETLSTGIQDAVGFCLRLALIDSMYRGEKPPVILDDTFANMDDANTTGALTVLNEVAQKYQVIYFTCHGK